MRSDLPRSRAELRAPAISFGGTRTTRSPRASRKRSSAPETCRQSSIAHTRSRRRGARAHTSRSSNDAASRGTVRSATTRPVAASTAATVCESLCVSAPITIIRTVPSLGYTNGSPVDTSQSGRCHAPIKSRRDPRTAAGDTTTDSQTHGRHQAYESARRRTEDLPVASDATARRDALSH